MDQEFVSKALEANLAETRYRDIYIPDDHLEFIRLSEGYYGINKRANDCITEYHHPLINRKFVVEELREILITDYWFYTRDNIEQNCYKIPIGMLRELLQPTLAPELQRQAIQTLLEFINLIMSKKVSHSAIAYQCLDLLDDSFDRCSESFILSSKFFPKFLSSASEHKQLTALCLSVTSRVLHSTYTYWKETSDVNHLIESKSGLFSPYREKINMNIGEPYFNELFDRLSRTTAWTDGINQLPVHDDLAERFAAATDLFQAFITKFHYVFYLLHLPGMSVLRERMIWSLDKMIRQAVEELEEDEINAFIDTIFELAAELRESHMSAVLDFILTLGLKVVDTDLTDHKEHINYFEKKLIAFGFVTPGMVFVDEDWQLTVNENHIKNIRVWLMLIEYSQSGMEKLLSALIVNLRLGGIFISDTDLFQREITKILNSNIAPYYKKVKQLTRIFPVYFSEIGAEGEIRKVTTTMDEISGRQDRLIHFLRKQVHTESNNTLIGLTRRIFNFWYDGKLEALRDLLPQNVYESIDTEGRWFAPVHQLVTQMAELSGKDAERLLDISHDEFNRLIERLETDNQFDVERLRDIRDLYAHLKEKYSFESVNIIQLLKRYPFIPAKDIDKLERAIRKNDFGQSLRLIYSFMDKLKKIIFNPEESESWENIYHKRHIAIGIPSMYGVYRENKFEALGLTFRLEKVATRLMEQVVDTINLDYISAKTLEEINVILEYFREGLELDGITNQSFTSNLQMLRYSLTSRSFSFDQYINIFQFLTEDVKRIIIKYFLKSYEYPLKVIVPQMFDPEGKLPEKESQKLLSRKSEEFHRDVIAEAFLVQPLDNFISRILLSLRNMSGSLHSSLISDIMSYNSELVISPLDEFTPKMDNQVFLGSKAYHLKNLRINGFPIPPGFVITSEVFRRRNAIMGLRELRKELDDLIRKHLERLEKSSGKGYGNPVAPLLLSVRSGTAISMPGAMDTILNVGLNDELVEEISRQERYKWSIWDSYRRLLQSWGMANGIERDTFDEVMSNFKRELQVTKKLEFEPVDMKRIAMAYKQVLRDYHVVFEEDLFNQLIQTINMVFESWSSERAFVYRRHLQISDNWGTAVIVQQMIFGNLNNNSGTGVIFTQNPQRERPGVHLYGDFTMRSQGEDIVAGLVKPLPVSESQRRHASIHAASMQTIYPAIYKKLYDLATELTENHGYSPQEIEFTFESDQPDDLYILQTRDQDLRIDQEIYRFTLPPEDMEIIGRGIGIGGGAMNGLAAFDEQDMEELRHEHPGMNMILIRPDTVPDDIGMVFSCDGLLTARGGATSHAAVTAVRLGKTCVVSCSGLLVDENAKMCQFENRTIYKGEYISIDGRLGIIYQGHYHIEQALMSESDYF
jgi:pyruvate,orthophosphate dikinase